MLESTLTAKGQTTVPKSIRTALGIGPGDRMRYLVLDNGEVRILKLRDAVSLAGRLHRPGQGARTLDDMETAIAEAANG